MIKQVLFIVFIVHYCLPLAIGQKKILEIIPLNQDIQFDGKLDESFWNNMTSISTTQFLPKNGNKPVEDAEIYVTYNKDYLYLVAKINGDNISSTSKKRDEFGLKPDYIGILLDGYRDEENALGFLTTPAALRTDFTIYDDAVGDFPVNLDWNTYWEVKTHRSINQWSVEMRIPFSSLQFQEKDGIVEMGMTIWRSNASKNEVSTFPHIKKDWGLWSSFKPSQSQVIRLKGIKASKPIYITPYLLAGTQRSIDSESPFDADIKNNLEFGIDVKYSLTSNLTLDLTINTDFAQVEVDDAQVNLDRFSLFFPEKRQFFQERAAIFDLRTGGPNRIFYSRKIGIDEDGNLEKTMGGVRLTGRVGNYDIGFINMTTRNDNWGVKNNFSIYRIRKKVLNANSYIGFLGTSKTNFIGEYNHVYALEGTFRLKKNNLLKLRFAQSFTDNYNNNPLSLDPTRILITIEKTQFNGFTYDLAYGRRGKDYNPELGFENRTNFTALFAILAYGWSKPEESKLLQQKLQLFNFSFIDNETNLDETSNIGLSFTTDWKSGHGLEVSSIIRRERLFENVDILDDFSVATGLYPINVWGIDYYSPSTKRFQYNLGFNIGDIFDSKFYNIEQSFDWGVTPDLNLGVFYNYNPIYLKSWKSDQIIHVHLARLKFLYTMNTKFSLSGFVQASSEGQLGLGNLRFRYNPREGVDLFLVYNNTTDLDLLIQQKETRRSQKDQVFITKFTYTFRL